MTHGTSLPANRLASETSPYLLQHQHNPVDWFPWGDEALAKARAEDKPIFLSVGYSACHWCHVMERESFEQPAIAALMNEHFINIKVDREERPDIDQIYMNAVQAMTGHGGWPMSVFLTPDQKPFFGGTYFPPVDSRGMAGFPRILESVARAWRERRDEILTSAGQMTAQLETIGAVAPSEGDLDVSLLDNAYRRLSRAFDPRHGGFGDAPKFPHAMDLKVLLRHHLRTGDEHALHMVRLTLEKMARGGIYDHLGGGFARYSTDDRWLVPHFEKMLYDNALLASAYLEAFQVTRDKELAQVARETLDYVINHMIEPEGGIASTEDADSEGVEGKFYVWSLKEVQQILGEERAKTFAYVYDVTPQGNWEETSILNMPKPLDQAARLLGRDLDGLRADLAEDRKALFEARARRTPPAKDTKVLVSWNGMMLGPLAEGARILREPRYLQAAERCAGFLLDTMRQADGRLLHGFKDGRARFNAYLDDYACLIDGLTRLYENSGTGRWIEAALELSAVMIDEFGDPDGPGFFFTGRSHESLIVRQKDFFDNATPSGNGMAATALLRLAAITGRNDLLVKGQDVLNASRSVMQQVPTAAGQSLIALDFLLGKTKEIAVIAGTDRQEWTRALERLASRFAPHEVVAPLADSSAPASVALLADRPSLDGQLTTYVCEGFTCEAPLVGLQALVDSIGDTA